MDTKKKGTQARAVFRPNVDVNLKESSAQTPEWLRHWEKLLCVERIPEKKLRGIDRKKGAETQIHDHRTAHERDFDRVVFSAPVRRLKDKTQVFPLEMHDGVRTRLTHSMEVSNLARSMGVAIASRIRALAELKDAVRNVPAILAAVSLAHDLGNPPFGHQGEEAIRDWVRSHEKIIRDQSNDRKFDTAKFDDFLKFEGNAQGFRILTRLQYQDHNSGLRLTASTLRSFMKYPWGSGFVRNGKAVKKFGYFQSEKDIFRWCTEKTGCGENRHPLSYLMEVCDDIAYSVLDVEDGVKKGFVSVPELASFLGTGKNLDTGKKYADDKRVSYLLNQYKRNHGWLSKLTMPISESRAVQISNKEMREASAELIRSFAIAIMVSDAIDYFVARYEKGDLHKLDKDIAGGFDSRVLMIGLKDFARLRIYKHPEVLQSELLGHRVIPKLMSAFWRAVCAHCRGDASKQDQYVFSLMSPNYVRVFWQSVDLNLPLWYRQLQLVCDQVCGMTDSYAVRTYNDLKELEVL